MVVYYVTWTGCNLRHYEKKSVQISGNETTASKIMSHQDKVFCVLRSRRNTYQYRMLKTWLFSKKMDIDNNNYILKINGDHPPLLILTGMCECSSHIVFFHIVGLTVLIHDNNNKPSAVFTPFARSTPPRFFLGGKLLF